MLVVMYMLNKIELKINFLKLIMNFVGEWNSKVTGKSGNVELVLPYGRFERQLIEGAKLLMKFQDEYKIYELAGKSKRGHYFLHCQNIFVHLEFIDSVNLEGYYISTKDAGVILVECETKCIGCLEEQPNQLAHMEMGGCLYSEK